MAMTITTQQTNSTLKNTDSGLKIDTITVVVNFNSEDNYFGGQVVLTAKDDAISFNNTMDEISDMAINKAKLMISAATKPNFNV
ncbi:MAG: hypothetical protein ABF768_07540 [Leuconostoc falkenbergense]|jgi:hypothetical protein|uniref:hypothetical protein n=1 Tax=Leuconostoc falkenbergense TaxID=2766470 RepID=UPI0039E9CC9D|nr:hypothetical protein [Leuconostoc mesenteroides]